VTDKNQRVLSIAGSIVAVGLVGLLWFITWALAFHEIPASNATSFSTVLGIIGIQVGIVIGYFFGQTMGNRAKDDTIKAATTATATMADTAAVAQAALAPKTPADVIPLAPGDSVTATAIPPIPTPPQP
jgi:predicted Na+-dependent transporter